MNKQKFILCALLACLTLLSVGCGNDANDSLKPKVPASTTTQKKEEVSDYQGREDELVNVVNIMFADGNNFSLIYEGASYTKIQDTLTIYVNSNWNRITDADKHEFIKAVFSCWEMAAHSRQLKFVPNRFHMRFVIKPEQTVATWDSLLGPSIK